MWVGKRKFSFQLGIYSLSELVVIRDEGAYVGIDGEWSKSSMCH